MYRLHVVSGPDLGRSFELEGEMIHIGRSPENEIRIKDRFISGNHLTLRAKDGKYYLKDLESANGTFVDGTLIRRGVEVELAEGVPVVIGMSVICLGEQCSNDVVELIKSVRFPEKSKQKGMACRRDRPATVLKNMELLRKVSETLTQSLDLGDVLDRILQSLLDLLKRVDRAAIIVLNQKTGEIRYVRIKVREGFAGEADGYCEDVVKDVIETGKEVMVLDQVSGDRLRLLESIRSYNVQSVMCVPLVNRSEVSGAIYVDSITNPHAFRKDDLSFFKALGIPAAHALQNAILYSKSTRLSKRRNE